MKTQPLRQDKHCLNCGTEVPERYCTHCGQENAVSHESFGHLVKHFVGDVLHYDSQFLTTLKYLLFRPGRLTKEYMAGKRVTYVNPIKLYIFVSFVFFLVLALLGHSSHEEDEHEEKAKKEHVKKDTIPSVGQVLGIVKDSIASYRYTESGDTDTTLVAGGDSVYRYHPATGEKGKKGLTLTRSAKKDTTRIKPKPEPDEDETIYRSVASYDSAQASLPEVERDSRFERWITRRSLRIGHEYKQDEFEEAIKHNVPKMMFVLLPLFALWLKILYRKRYYADHAIFALHVHCFAYVMLLITLMLDYLVDTNQFTVWGSLLIGIYVWLALRNTYQQSFRRSFLKTLLLLTGYGISFAIVFALFVSFLFAVIL